MDAPPTPPAAPEPALQTAARLLAEGRLADAVARLGALIAEAPAYAAAHVLHATALEAAGRLSDALDAWGHAALLVPTSPLVRRERARLAAVAAAPPPPAEPAPVEPPADDVAPSPAREAGPAVEAVGVPDAGIASPADETAPPRSEIEAPVDASPVDVPPSAPTTPSFPPVDAEAFETDLVLSFAEPEPSVETSSSEPPSSEPPPVDAVVGPTSTLLEPSETTDEPASLFETVHLSSPEAAPVAEPERDDDEVALPSSADAPADDPDLLSLHDYRPGATATPFFGDDDEAADWGDLPPLTAPILPPEAPTATDEPPPAPEPEADWRIVDETSGEPEAPVFEDAFEAPPEPADDLDDLISRLEQAPRIRPDPAFNGPAVTVDESGVDEMVSETLAKIYAAQHRYVEAAVMYEKLAAREPDQAGEMLRRAAELRDRR